MEKLFDDEHHATPEAKASHIDLVERPVATQRRAAIVLLSLLVLMWGCNWPINKAILTYVSPLWYACLRLGLGAFSLFLAQAFLKSTSNRRAVSIFPLFLALASFKWRRLSR